MGNAIGENNPKLAWKYFKLTSTFAISAIFIWVSSFYIFRDYVAMVYIKVEDEHSRKLTELFIDGLKLMVPVMYSDCTNGFFHGAIRGLGLQSPASIICLIVFYVFATPSGCILAFKFDMGLHGIITGFLIGTLMQVTSFFFLIVCSDWNKIAEKVYKEH